MPDEFKQQNTVQAYRTFYVQDKVKIKQLKWNKLNNQPTWINE
jgi:hypothetical protein